MTHEELKAIALQKHQVRLATMRHFLIGSKFHTALKAMEFAKKLHNGTRKNGIHPEFSHQIYQSNHLRTLIPSLIYPEETLAVDFLHDVIEDCNISRHELANLYGEQIASSTLKMSKKIRGIKIPDDEYYGAMADDVICSIVKPEDRAHNFLDMEEADWDVVKQREYVAVMDNRILPIIRHAREIFTTQGPAYENIKILLQAQKKHIICGLQYRESLEKIVGENKEPSSFKI